MLKGHIPFSLVFGQCCGDRNHNSLPGRHGLTSPNAGVSKRLFSKIETRAMLKYNTRDCGERSPAVKAPGCGPGDRGFKSHRSPQFVFASIAQRTRAPVFGFLGRMFPRVMLRI